MNGDPLVVRAYRAATRLYPARFRDDYADDMVSLLREQYRDEPGWRAASRAAVDLALTIPTQHLEATMRRPASSFVSIIYLTIALAGALVVAVGGSNPTMVIVGLAIALGFGAVGIAAVRRAMPIRAPGLTEHWWRFLVAGPCLITLVIAGSGLGIEAWSLGVVTVLTALLATAIGLGLGCAHLVAHRNHRIPT